MRLERILTHRLIRFVRAVLPFLVVVLIAIPAWNYYAKRVRKSNVTKPGANLPGNVSVRTEGFSYSQMKGGRTQFTVHAKQSLGFKDDKYTLQDVDVTVYGDTESDPPRTIHGKNCIYDTTNDFECMGDVEVHLDQKTIIRTEHVIYSHRDGIVTAPLPATIEQNGANGRANSLEYGTNSGLLKLNGDVKLETADHVKVETSAALFQQKENWTTMAGGVRIQSASGWVQGNAARADLTPETYKPKLVTFDGNVAGESQSRTTQERWKFGAGWMETTINQAGLAEQVKARKDVQMEKIAGNTHQRLSGSEVDTTLKDGKVDLLEARQNARMVFGDDQTLESSQIWTSAAGLIETKDKSLLKFGDSTIQGTAFRIQTTQDSVTFNTEHRATLKKDTGQESSSDQTRARFDSRNSMLVELVQNGNFQFRTPQYEGRARSGRFEDGGGVITLDGAPVVNDSEKRLEAAQIRINQNDNSFVATKNVSTLIKNATDPVLVKAEHAEGGADTMLYTGNVQLWRGEAYIKADRLNAKQQSSQNNILHAEASKGNRVQSNLQNVRATSDALDYDDARGVVHYTGRVRAQKQDMILETPDLTVHFHDKDVTQIVATGGVVVTRADQRGTGDRAEYEASTDLVTLTGKPAQVRDSEGLVEGARLTMKNKGQNVHVEAADGERTTTKHPVKKK